MFFAIRDFLFYESRLYQIASDIKGLAIGAYSSIAIHWLPRIIKVFQQEYAKIEIK